MAIVKDPDIEDVAVWFRGEDRIQVRWRSDPTQIYCYRTFFLNDWDDDDNPPIPGFHRQ